MKRFFLINSLIAVLIMVYWQDADREDLLPYFFQEEFLKNDSGLSSRLIDTLLVNVTESALGYLLPHDLLPHDLLSSNFLQNNTLLTKNGVVSPPAQKNSIDVSQQKNIIDHYTAQQINVIPELEYLHSVFKNVKVGQNVVNSITLENKRKARKVLERLQKEKTLWTLLKQQRFSQVKSKIRQFKERDSAWIPSEQMLSQLESGVIQRQLEIAIKQQRSQRVIDLSKLYPTEFTCKKVYNLWAKADAYVALYQLNKASSVYQFILKNCSNNDDRIISLYKAWNSLSSSQIESLIKLEEVNDKDPENQLKFNQYRYRYYINRLLAEIDSNNFNVAMTYLEKISEDINVYQDVEVALYVGWIHYDVNQYKEAEKWFLKVYQWSTNESAAFALAMSLYQQNRLEEAKYILKNVTMKSYRVRQLLTDISTYFAMQSYHQGNYKISLKYVKETISNGRNARDMQLLNAWNYYHLAEDNQASDLFEKLYASHPDESSGQGLFNSYVRKKDYTELQASVEKYGGEPLVRLWQQHLAKRDYWQGRYFSAYQQSPNEFPELDNLATPQIGLGLMQEQRSGASGLSKLRLQKKPLAQLLFTRQSVNRWLIEIDNIELDAGNLAPQAQVGAFLPISMQDYQFSPTTKINAGVEPHVSYYRDGWLTPYFDVGSTPLSGVVSNKLTWKFGLTQQVKGGFWDVMLFSQPVRESILSYVGLRDPYTGQKWGRVIKTGIGLSGFYPMAKKWGIFGKVDYFQATGTDVLDNRAFSLSATLTRNLQSDAHKLFSFGSTIRLQNYANNLSQFTFGHGGYFSPQNRLQAGLVVSLRTQEGQAFLLQGELFAGHQQYEEKSTPIFPQAPDGQTSSAKKKSEIGLITSFKGLWQFADHLQLGGQLDFDNTENFNSRKALMLIRYNMKARSKLFSSDLASFDSGNI